MSSRLSKPAAMNRSRINLPSRGGHRLRVTLGRSARRRCPYCGGPRIFKGWFSLKERCPTCGVLFAYEDGYFLGSYAINLVISLILGIALVIWLIAGTDFSVLQMQIIGVVCAIGFPVFFYPYALLIWIVIDLYVNPPGDFSQRPRT